MHISKKIKLMQIKKQRGSLLSGQSDISLTTLLSSEHCQSLLNECREFRDRVYTPLTTVLIFIKQVLNPDKSCKKAVAGVIVEQLSSGKATVSSNTGPYCKARKRLPEDVVRELVKEVGTSASNRVPSQWKPYGRELKVFDGSTVTMADTPENQKVFPQHKNQKKGLGFPILRLVAVISLITGTVIDYAVAANKGKGTGESSLLRSILKSINPDDIVLGDRYYPNFFLMADLKKNRCGWNFSWSKSEEL